MSKDQNIWCFSIFVLQQPKSSHPLKNIMIAPAGPYPNPAGSSNLTEPNLT